MPANNPEEICSLFRKYMAEGDLESLITLYDSGAVFLNQSRELKKGRDELRQELAPFAAARTIFGYNIRQIIQSGDVALMHTDWEVSAPERMFVHAIEVARRQPDGTWCWLIGDPFTVDKRMSG